MNNGSARGHSHWDALIPGYLKGDPTDSTTLVQSVTPYMRRIAKSLAPDIPADIHNEMVQQAFLDTFRLGHKFDPTRMTAKQFLRGCTWNAIRIVRAQYDWVGRPHRKLKQDSEAPAPPRTVPVPLDDAIEVQDFAAARSFAQTEARIDVDRICRTAPVRLRSALRLMRGGRSLGEAAKETGQSRFSLRYALNAYTAA